MRAHTLCFLLCNPSSCAHTYTHARTHAYTQARSQAQAGSRAPTRPAFCLANPSHGHTQARAHKHSTRARAHTPCRTPRVRTEVRALAPSGWTQAVSEGHLARSSAGGQSDSLCGRRSAAEGWGREGGRRGAPGVRFPCGHNLPGFLPINTGGLGADVQRGVPPGVLRGRQAAPPDPQAHSCSTGRQGSPAQTRSHQADDFLLSNYFWGPAWWEEKGRCSGQWFLGKALVENNYKLFGNSLGPGSAAETWTQWPETRPRSALRRCGLALRGDPLDAPSPHGIFGSLFLTQASASPHKLCRSLRVCAKDQGLIS